LVAAVKINCEFLTADRWKVERKQRIVVHGGCGGALMHIATCLDKICYVNRGLGATVAAKFSYLMNFPG
jgi:hypothetical protein